MHKSYHVSCSTTHTFVQGFVHSMVRLANETCLAGMSSDEFSLSFCSLMLQQFPNIFHRTISRCTIHNQVLDVRIVLLEHAMNGSVNCTLSVIAGCDDGYFHKEKIPTKLIYLSIYVSPHIFLTSQSGRRLIKMTFAL